MTVLASTSYLETNLASLGERNADLADAFANVATRSDMVFVASGEAVPSASIDGKQLCSRHRPLEEAQRQSEGIDLVEHAVVVIMGFGLGYHVQKIAERSAKATLIVVFEPDVSLLKTVLTQIDHSSWMKDALLLFVTAADDRGALATKLAGAESILAQGVHFLEHPASRERLRDASRRFTANFTEFITAAKTTLMTTLMRSVDTTRNLMLNLDHYVGGEGVEALRNIAIGTPAVVVSAGPSLQKNMHRLREPGVRDRCIIIAVQTTLKPLLAAGIRPHFVTALDYHEISRRFYEDLRAEDVRDVTLIADPKAHPVILDSYPGPVRCCANPFLDRVLGPLAQPMGELPAGATVAHLALYVARFLGCNPIALIGQDLGFSDGLYYAPSPGLAVHDVWAPELNPFNTIEMMEWQRIVRHRLHLHKTVDVDGKSIYTDAQMHTYLQQFERDFLHYKREGLTVIDATEGGVRKQHTVTMRLQDFLTDHARSPLPPFPRPAAINRRRLAEARQRMTHVRNDVQRLRELSKQTANLLERMLEDRDDLGKMSTHFAQVERNRKEVESRFEAFELLNHLNQMGVFNRMKADRRLHMQVNLSSREKQRLQLERDLVNVRWIADAADEMLLQLESSDRVLAGNAATKAPSPSSKAAPGLTVNTNTQTCVSCLIALDPECNGLGIPRSLDESIEGRNVLQATLERVGVSDALDSIILIVPRSFDIESRIDRSRIKLPLYIERIDGSPYGPERRAIAAARLWSDTCWRGGIAGMSVYDEILCPAVMLPVMRKHHLTAALIVGPDWPLVRVTEAGGCDDLIARHREHPEKLNLVFTQSPPGLCGCVISASLMEELAQRNRLSTIGGLLVYQPHAPQGDPIARDANVQIEHTVRHQQRRFTFDSPRQRQIMAGACVETPQHIVVELCAKRMSSGLFAASKRAATARGFIAVDQVQQFLKQLQPDMWNDMVLSLDGCGDALLHPHFDQIIAMAKSQGIRGVHVRTELLCDRTTIDRLIKCDVDVVSVDLNADRAATYERMMGVDRFKDVLLNIEYLLNSRTRLTDHAGTSAFAMPWVVPHLQRRAETYEDVESFYDRWMQVLGCAVIEGIPDGVTDSLSRAITPESAVMRDRRRTITLLADGQIIRSSGKTQR